MQQPTAHSARYLQQRKFFVMLPVLVFPFLTFLLWSIGLIGVVKTQAQTTSQKGLNPNLPGAMPAKDSNWNKLKFYEQADKDSAKYKSLQKNDPNFTLSLSKPAESSMSDTMLPSKELGKGPKLSYDPYSSGFQTGKDANEERVYKKLAQLNSALSEQKPPVDINKDEAMVNSNQPSSATVNTGDINRLENMMQTMQGADNASDPEMQQISGMLEKILDIQHPERVKDKLKQQSESNKQQVFAVTGSNKKVAVSLLQSKLSDSLKRNQTAQTQNSFYSLEDAFSSLSELQNAIAAVIPVTQTLVSGAIVKLQLSNEVYINGILIPKDEIISGTASLEDERLTIKITTIQYKNNILPVALTVYDMDGIDGIYVPGAIGRDVAKQSTEQAIQGIGLASLDPSIGAQAASAGIQAAKSLIGKKVKQIKVTVKAGYQVLLRDENKKNK